MSAGKGRRPRRWSRRALARAPENLSAFDDSALMDAFHLQHRGSLLAFCIWLTNNDRKYAVGVANEALSRAGADRVVLRQPSRLARAWLFKLACTLVIDDWRMESSAIDATDYGADALADIDGRDVVTEVVSAAFACLTREERVILVECYVKKSSIGDVAHRWGVPPSTVKSRAHDALQSLRAHATDMGVETRLWAAKERISAD